MGGSSDEGFMSATKDHSDWDAEVRMGFIRKVFGILAVQLMVTFGYIGLTISSESLTATMQSPEMSIAIVPLCIMAFVV